MNKQRTYTRTQLKTNTERRRGNERINEKQLEVLFRFKRKNLGDRKSSRIRKRWEPMRKHCRITRRIGRKATTEQYDHAKDDKRLGFFYVDR